ncbi:NAD(P)/FAD-dependent oxidoreductase [Nocardioides jishulii]|uniref:NAD(P)/FAD-dependent oxidoreductase n=1 Tax=Nocardioides jishulii TaxID=2575440 RepID=A0A4U2YMX2_9ACTN|nr:NAD(P)/FAD-dependent oxidoreductase [Nocardioides jishulii]QCX27378.1 NAD(P)/FAD-dependent oxidoreductase [Nocardioides jishulii]TKI62184.1 NAD(P)/FAD-dependent oxidoreductase [Nocardioides jishulii]
MRDLIVAGGGPVGLFTALYAARSGLDVVVHEPRTGVVDKACGEGLMPGAVARLGDLGVQVPGVPLAGIRYLDGSGHVAEAPFRHGPGLGARRTRLHAALLERVAEAGVEVQPTRVRQLVDRDDHLLVDGTPTRFLVAADGLHSPVRRMVGLDAAARRRPGPRRAARRRHGLRRHFLVAPWTAFVEVHWSRRAEAYVTPVGPDEVGVAVLSAERAHFDEHLAQFPALLTRLEGSPRSVVRGAGPLRQDVVGRVRGRVLLVGDAAGYVDALTGEGIALGAGQAEAAVRAIVAGDPEAYEGSARRLGRRHDLLTRGLLLGTRSDVARRMVVPAAQRLPGVFSAAVDQLARPV